MAGSDEPTRELSELRSRHRAVVDVLHALSGSGMRLQRFARPVRAYELRRLLEA